MTLIIKFKCPKTNKYIARCWRENLETRKVEYCEFFDTKKGCKYQKTVAKKM